ncbi:MAG: type 1 glutamine amidotransferase [Pseudomonadota bacterium]
MRILVVDSDTAEINARSKAAVGQTTGEGYAAALRACVPDLEVAIIAPYVGETRDDLAEFDGVAFTGSGVSWCTDEPQARPLAVVMEACFKAGLPVVGSCNGMQLAATVLGGSNRAAPKGREDGLALDIHLTEAGRSHPFMVGRVDGYAVPCVHRDEVHRLPEGAQILASNAHSDVQAFSFEQGDVRFWGVQYHPEYSLPFIAGRARTWKRVSAQMADDIERAADDAAAAKRLGVRIEDMQPEVRLSELNNWLHSL